MTAPLRRSLIARPTLLVATVATAAAGSIGYAAQVSAAPPAQSPAAPAASYAPGHVLVHYKSGVSSASQVALEHANGASRLKQISDIAVDVLNVPVGSEQRVIDALQHSGKVQYAERDAIATADDVQPNDYWWPQEWSPVKVNAPSAWTTTTGSSAVVVADVDTGVTAVPDLNGKLTAGWDFVNNDSDPSDDHGHGTMTAGVIGAASNNSVGVTSFCWGCMIMPVKVLGTDGTGTYSDIANGIAYAADHGAKVINMSLSGATDSSTMRNAVDYAHNKGAVLVAAAGNDGTTALQYPAAYSDVIGVAATDNYDGRASYSSYGSWVDVAAPGSNYTTSRTGSYGSFAGTSSAAPVVAGIAGLLFSASADATNATVEHAIDSTSTGVGSFVNYGRVDAAAAVNAVISNTPLTSPSPTPSPAPTATASPSPTPSPAPTATASPSPTPSPSASATTTTFSGSLNAKSTSKSFTQTIGAGPATASLSFTKASSMTVTLLAPDGSSVTSASGGSPVTLSATVGKGTYTWTVSGPSRATFALSVQASTP